jgi:hypothetical protein
MPEDKDRRNLLYESKPYVYRAIYSIVKRQKEIEIFHVRHGARQEFKSRDLR